MKRDSTRSELIITTKSDPAQREIRYERNFDMLLYDSIEMLLRSRNFDPLDSFTQSLARASIINSLLLLEAAANICLDYLALERRTLEEIDRLPTLAKFNYFLAVGFRNRKLDNGKSVVLAARELKMLRDRLVHPKANIVEWLVSGEEGTSEPVLTKILRVPKNPNAWDSDHAAIVMKSVHGFLKYFFREKCKYTATKTTSILFSELRTPSDEEYFMPFFDRETKALLTQVGIDLSYLKLVWG